MRSRTLPLEIVGDHPIVRLRGHGAVIDTGSPLTFRAPQIVSEQLGQPIRWLVGTDALRRDRVLIDWRGRRFVIGGPTIRGQAIDLVPTQGVFQIAIEGPNGFAMAFLDSGAPISYAPAAAVRGRTAIGRRRDFYPLFGAFDVDLYQMRVRVGGRDLDASFGVLPELLAGLLRVVGNDGWILGIDFFRDRAIQLDLARNRLIDAPADAVRARVTRPEGRSMSAGNGPFEGWRGWRLASTESGAPKLVSLTARDVWDGPVFVSDRLPVLRGPGEDSGVHACRTPGGLASLVSCSAAVVYGQVTLFGQVCVHETGYRAERARIDRLFVRACGHHRPIRPQLHGGATTLFELLARKNTLAGAYCGCRSLAHEEWLSYEQLERLASSLGDRYQCDVTVDMERARVSDHLCAGRRLFPELSTRNR